MTKFRTKNNKLNSIGGLLRSLSSYIVDTKEKIKTKQTTHQVELVTPDLHQKVIRVLRWYEKDGDALIGERMLNNINLSELQKLFGEPKDNLMFECYPITQLQARFLQRTLKQSFDLRSYAYFLECDAD
jgi:hypothetical protein